MFTIVKFCQIIKVWLVLFVNVIIAAHQLSCRVLFYKTTAFPTDPVFIFNAGLVLGGSTGQDGLLVGGNKFVQVPVDNYLA